MQKHLAGRVGVGQRTVGLVMRNAKQRAEHAQAVGRRAWDQQCGQFKRVEGSLGKAHALGFEHLQVKADRMAHQRVTFHKARQFGRYLGKARRIGQHFRRDMG